MQARVIASAESGRPVKIFANESPSWWEGFLINGEEHGVEFFPSTKVIFSGDFKEDNPGIFRLYRDSICEFVETASDIKRAVATVVGTRQMDFRAKIPEDLHHRVTSRLRATKGDRGIFLTKALEAQLNRERHDGIDNWTTQNPGPICSTKSQRLQGLIDETTLGVLELRAKELNCSISDLFNSILRDSYRDRKGLWSIQPGE